MSFLLWGVIAAALFHYPVAAVWLGLFLIGYTALLVYFPYAWLVVIPALLPIMDFAPWTGRFFFDEFDLLILTTLAFYYWQKPKWRYTFAIVDTHDFIIGFVQCVVWGEFAQGFVALA